MPSGSSLSSASDDSYTTRFSCWDEGPLRLLGEHCFCVLAPRKPPRFHHSDAGLLLITDDSPVPAGQLSLSQKSKGNSRPLLITADSSGPADQNHRFFTQKPGRVFASLLKCHKPERQGLHCSQHGYLPSPCGTVHGALNTQ